MVLVASPEIQNRYPDFVTPDRNHSAPSLIINEPNCIFPADFEQYLRDKSIILDHTIGLWGIPTIKNLIKNNVGFLSSRIYSNRGIKPWVIGENSNRYFRHKNPLPSARTIKQVGSSPAHAAVYQFMDSVSCGGER